MAVTESEPKAAKDGTKFTTITLSVFGGGDYPHYLDLPRGFDLSQIPEPGQPVRCAVSLRPYASSTAKSGAGVGLTLRAVLPALAPAAA